jgi:hypothetical protein
MHKRGQQQHKDGTRSSSSCHGSNSSVGPTSPAITLGKQSLLQLLNLLQVTNIVCEFNAGLAI